MRIRHKPWAKPELDACPFCIENPQELKGKWNTVFKDNTKPLYIELGCGKGGFISQISVEKLDVNFLAMDIKNEMLVLAKRKVEEAYNTRNISIDNVKLFNQNIEMLQTTFDENDSVDRIYINFCNPWPKIRHKKRRLTHTRQLVNYKKILRLDGELWFKTDDDELFEESFEYFKEAGFEVKFKTFDLHSEKDIENFKTEHEKMFTDIGKKIKFLIAVPQNICIDK